MKTAYPNNFTKEQIHQIVLGLAARRYLLDPEHQGEWDIARLDAVGQIDGQVGDGTGSGIKCDVEHCNFVDHNVDPEEMMGWVNKPCPVCGANLLTEADMLAMGGMYIKMIKLNKFANKWAPRLPNFIRNWIFSQPKKALIASQNGSGKVKLEVKEKDSVSTES